MSNHIPRRTFIVGSAVGVVGGSIATLRAPAQTPQARPDVSRVKALVFDTFGTVVGLADVGEIRNWDAR